MHRSDGGRQSDLGIAEKFNTLIIQHHEFDGHAAFANGQGKNVVLAYLVIILLRAIEIVFPRCGDISARFAVEQIHEIRLVFIFLIAETISEISVQNKFLMKKLIGAQVETHARSFLNIISKPVEPGTDLKIAYIEI